MTIARLCRLMVAAAVLLLGVLVSPADAHDEVVSSTPADGSTVSEVPATITITLSAGPQGTTAPAEVLVGDAAPVSVVAAVSGDSLVIDTSDPALAQILADPAGPWVVSFEVTGSDGHAIDGSVSFTVEASAAPAAPAATPTSDPAQPSTDPADSAEDTQAPAEQVEPATDGGLPWWGFVLIGAAAVAAAAAVATRLLRRPPGDDVDRAR